jgi:endonuclease/exonuclease/phosphatase family metal-dependent hydrolase
MPIVPRALLLFACLALAPAAAAQEPAELPPYPGQEIPPPGPGLRVASFNSSLYSEQDGGLAARLEAGDPGARQIAAVIQHVRPDLLLLNEFDFDAEGRAATLFQTRYLQVAQEGQAPIRYPYRYFAPVNTGVPSGMDLDRNGVVGGDGRERGNDAFGYGLHPGQYGMLVLSMHPIEVEGIRSFRLLRWSRMPDPMQPRMADGQAWYPPEVWERLRLSSKSHWDVPVRTPLGRLHFLVSHPTPPVFDGPEDRNGARNHDEIRLWREYLSQPQSDWLCDDAGRCGGLAEGERFVVAGDLNNDPHDGDGRHPAILGLIGHPRMLRMPAPRSEGGTAAAVRDGGANATHRGDPAEDTGRFEPRIGSLRLDYVLPSIGLVVEDSGVFWPRPGETGADWLEATDHRMVWVDLGLDEPAVPAATGSR